MNHGKRKQPTKSPLSQELASKLREFIAREGEESAVNALSLNLTTLAKASGGMAVGHGTAAIIALRLQEGRS